MTAEELKSTPSGREERPEPPPGIFGLVGGINLVGAWARMTFASFRLRNYRYFFIGQGISAVGTWMRRTAMGWLVYEMTGSRALLGTVLGLSLLPLFILSPTAGALADRVDKRKLILASQVLATAVSAAIAVLIFGGWIRVWHLMVLATLGGIAFAFEVPARQAFVYDMVGKDYLMNAIALNSAMFNLSRILGPAVAGIVMGTVGMGFCFLIDASTYLAFIAALLVMHLPPFRKPAAAGNHFQHLREGVREVFRNRRVRVILTLLFLVGVFGWSFQTLMPAIAQDILKIGETEYGMLMAMFGIGALFGALFVASRKPESNRRAQVFGGVWIMIVGLALLSLSRSLWSMSAPLLLAGFGAVSFISTGNTLVQTSVDDAIRGRIMGIWALAFGGSLPLGSFLAGLIAEVISPFATIQIFAAVLLAASLAIYARLPPKKPAPEAASSSAV